MRHYPSVWACAVLAGLFFVGAGAATEKSTPAKLAPFSRRNPITETVQKTRGAIVTIKVPRASGKDMVGTGVIVDESGYIVTNKHVVGGARTVKIELHNGDVFQGSVIVAESAYDLAVVSIKAGKKLQALHFAKGDDLMEGEMVIAIGHPYGYKNTVSSGIIGALDREIEMPTGDVLTGLIQHDASINPGNSGGPLFNINAEMIGINVALREGAQGIAFAINAETVKKLLARHLTAAKMAGVDHGLVCKEEVVGETGPRHKVVVETPSAPLVKGDQIVAVGATNVINKFDLERALWTTKPGDRVDVRVVREGKELTVSMTLRSGDGAVATVTPGPRGESNPGPGVAASDRR
jgi:serine protease Do